MTSMAISASVLPTSSKSFSSTCAASLPSRRRSWSRSTIALATETLFGSRVRGAPFRSFPSAF